MQLSEGALEGFVQDPAFLGNGVSGLQAQFSKDFRVFAELSHRGALGDMDRENEFPLEAIEGFPALAVDIVKAELAYLAVGVSPFVFELHGALLPLGEVLEGTLGVWLVLEGYLPAPPVDGPELYHLGKEGNDLLEDHNGLDGGEAVLGPFPCQLREGLEVDVLRVMADSKC